MTTQKNGATKKLTSLLLYSFFNREEFKRFLAEYNKLIENHSFPEFELVEVDKDIVKILINFPLSPHSSEFYYDAVNCFLKEEEQLIYKVVSIATPTVVCLSALINIDSDLAAFEIKVPKIPLTLSRLEAFEFEYFVWHLPNDDSK